MATSNSTNFEPNVAEFIEEAFERCGLELRTGYDLKTAQRSINLMLAEWANRGLNQWTISEATQTVTEGTREYTLNSNVIDILDVVLRRTEGGTTTDTQMSRVSRSECINTMDLPFRFYPCFVAGLAYYLSMKKNPQLTEQLKLIYEEEFRRAADEDEDRASFRITPYSQGY